MFLTVFLNAFNLNRNKRIMSINRDYKNNCQVYLRFFFVSFVSLTTNKKLTASAYGFDKDISLQKNILISAPRRWAEFMDLLVQQTES